MRPYLVVGMFRSGTTLLARMLHANRHVVCASDPYAPVFKAYRNHFGALRIPNFDGDSPLHDYYYDRVQNDLFQEMKGHDFGVPLTPTQLSELVPRIRRHSEAYSPLIHDHLSLLKGGTFADLFLTALQAIERAYPKRGAQAIGFKEVWVGEFTGQFLALAAASVIHVVRDPRAVAASNYVSGARYPLMFLARQWRKQAALAWLAAQRDSRVRLVRFEDLVTKPAAIAAELCRFIGADFDEAMVDADNLKDGAGQPWRQNSSYQDPGGSAKTAEVTNTAALEKWQSALPESYLRIIERVCGPEMRLLGYPRLIADVGPEPGSDELLFADDPESLANWIRPYSGHTYYKELAAERTRADLLREGAHRPDPAVQRLIALDPGIYDALRAGPAPGSPS